MQSHHGPWISYLYHDMPPGIPQATPGTDHPWTSSAPLSSCLLKWQWMSLYCLLLGTLRVGISACPSSCFAYVSEAIGVTCFLWDYLLSLDQEVKYIWSQKRWNFSHHAFVWKRYTSLVGLIYGAFRAYMLTPLTPCAHCESQ